MIDGSMKNLLEKFNTAKTWIDVDILAKLKGVSKRAIRLSFNNKNSKYETKIEKDKGGKLKLSKEDFKEIIETLSEVEFSDNAIKYITNRNLQFRQLVKVITKAEQLANTNKLSEISEEIIKGVINEE